MDKAIITMMLIIAGVVCVSVMFNSLYPALNRGSDAVVSMASAVDDRIKSQVDIIHAVSEYDSNDTGDYWNDMNSNSHFDIFAWVKNVGTSRILTPENSDIFFGEEGDFQRIPHETYAGGTAPYWQYSIEDSADEWGRSETMKINIVHTKNITEFSDTGLSTSTTYRIKLIIPNGITDEIYFSL